MHPAAAVEHTLVEWQPRTHAISASSASIRFYDAAAAANVDAAAKVASGISHCTWHQMDAVQHTHTHKHTYTHTHTNKHTHSHTHGRPKSTAVGHGLVANMSCGSASMRRPIGAILETGPSLTYSRSMNPAAAGLASAALVRKVVAY